MRVLEQTTTLTVLRKGKPVTFTIDKKDESLISQHTWCAQWNKRGNCFYATTWDKNTQKTITMHRLLLKAKRGEIVDHINHDTTNNTRANLRIATSQENSFNRKGACIDNKKSKYRGVSRRKESGKWEGRVCFKGKQHYLGAFNTEEQANRSVVKLRSELQAMSEVLE